MFRPGQFWNVLVTEFEYVYLLLNRLELMKSFPNTTNTITARSWSVKCTEKENMTSSTNVLRLVFPAWTFSNLIG